MVQIKKKDSIRELAKLIFKTAEDAKALDVAVLDLRKLSTIADYLIVCSATSNRQVQAIADRIEQNVKVKFKRYPLGIEGLENSFWVLVDYGDVVCHIFTEEARGFYRLESLWHDAKRVKFSVKKAKAA